MDMCHTHTHCLVKFFLHIDQSIVHIMPYELFSELYHYFLAFNPIHTISIAQSAKLNEMECVSVSCSTTGCVSQHSYAPRHQTRSSDLVHVHLPRATDRVTPLQRSR